MSVNKIKRLISQPVVTIFLIATVLLAGVTAIPPLRTGLLNYLDTGTNLLLFDGVEDEGEAADKGAQPAEARKPGTFKRIVTAPVRLVVGLFKRKNDPMAVRQATDKEIEKMKMIPLQRTQNGSSEQMADTGAPVAGEGHVAQLAAQNLFEEAVNLHDRGRIDAALEKLVAATVLQPNFAEAYNMLGVCYDQKYQYQAAQAEYKKAIKIEQDNGRYLNNIGYSYYLSGDEGAAIKWYKKGLKVTPHDRRLHNNLGLAYGRKGEYGKARDHFILAVGETGALLNLGFIYSQQGKYEEAIRQYQLALGAQPQSLPALSNLAQLYERTGRLREAAQLGEQYKKLVASNQQKEQAVDQQ